MSQGRGTEICEYAINNVVRENKSLVQFGAIFLSKSINSHEKRTYKILGENSDKLVLPPKKKCF